MNTFYLPSKIIEEGVATLDIGLVSRDLTENCGKAKGVYGCT